MHKNAIKIVWGVKFVALFPKFMVLFEEKIVVLFLALFGQIVVLPDLKLLDTLLTFPTPKWRCTYILKNVLANRTKFDFNAYLQIF